MLFIATFKYFDPLFVFIDYPYFSHALTFWSDLRHFAMEATQNLSTNTIETCKMEGNKTYKNKAIDFLLKTWKESWGFGESDETIPTTMCSFWRLN